MLRKLLFAFILISSISGQLMAQGGGDGCIRIISVDPATDFITISNTTNGTIDLGSYRLCSLFSYTGSGIAAGATTVFGNINAVPSNDIVIVLWPINDVAADVALYEPTGSFSDPNAMVDFMQYGSAGNGREGEAVSAGLWSAGQFVPGANTMVWAGACSDHSVSNWVTTGIEEFNLNAIRLSPNPVTENLEISFDGNMSAKTEIRVLDITGRTIHQESYSGLFGKRYSISTVSWKEGLYLVQIGTGDKVLETRRILKN